MAARLGPSEVSPFLHSVPACFSTKWLMLTEDLVPGGLRVGGGEISRARVLCKTIVSCGITIRPFFGNGHRVFTTCASCEVLLNVRVLLIAIAA
jgi:hypothetical protein